MNFLRTSLLIVVIAGSFSYSGYTYFKGPCADPLLYTIGTFNTEFGISEADFITAIKEAEAVWEKPVDKDLFAYNAVSGMPINLVYDERQATVQENKKRADNIDRISGSAEQVKAQLEATKISYARAKTEYESMLADFKTKQDSHVASVKYWNEQGGAPAREYSELSQNQNVLDTLYALLERKRVEVNNLADTLNSLVNSYNGLVKDINSDVAVINESADKEFEQGEYISNSQGSKINIYEFTDREALVRVLAHELGHALGIDHNQNPESIMYYLNKEMAPIASLDDLADLKKVCRLK